MQCSILKLQCVVRRFLAVRVMQKVIFEPCIKDEGTLTLSSVTHNLCEEHALTQLPGESCTAHDLDEGFAMVAHNPLSKVWGLAVHLDLFIRWYQKSGLKLLQRLKCKWIKEVAYGRTDGRNHASFLVFCEGIRMKLS